MDFASGDFRFSFQAAIFVGLALAAWKVGGGPEKVLAGVLVWFSAGDAVNHALFAAGTDYSTINAGHVVIEVVALAVSLAVAVFANRMYTLWFAAFQVLAVLAHLAREIVRDIASLAYLMMYVGPSYFQIILLAGGIWFHHRRERRFGPYRSWRSSSRRLRAPTRGNWPNG